jgi:colanic acid/amylovoran biosynthesis glycosyltransferase
MKTLAVIAPNLGARSETFIQRHMQDLLPGRTVVIALSNRPPTGGYWQVNSPTLLLQDSSSAVKIAAQKKTSLTKQVYHAILYKMGLQNSMFSAKKNTGSEMVEQFLIRHKVDVILSEYLDFSIDFIQIARKLNIPFFAHAHGYDISLRLQSEEWRKKYLALNETDGIILMNTYSKKILTDIGIQEEKLYTIPYGVTIGAQKEKATHNSTVRCLAVGRMVAKKAPILLLDSFRRAVEKFPDLHLDYIGEGDLLPAARQYIRAFRLEQKVTLHGALDHKGVLTSMQQADIFLQHSITCPDTGDQEGFPVAILEAMAHSLPVVSTLHSGIPEAVMEGQTGLLVQEGDTLGMAEKIVELTKNTELREQLGKAGRARVEMYFSWEKERESLLSLLSVR